MDNKILYTTVIIALVVSIFITTASAKGLNLFCPKEPNILITLKDEAKIEKAKIAILEIPEIKIIKIQDRDEEWSRTVNKYDLPNMENPFKSEFTVKFKRKADKDKIINRIKEMSFIEDVKYVYDTKCLANN